MRTAGESSMLIMPAIDLLEGRAVRLQQGNYDQVTVYGEPLDIAKRYKADGATHIHIVDLDAARSGVAHSATRKTVAEIITQTGLEVEIGGGIRTREDLQSWLQMGVWRCILGTAAVQDLSFVCAMIAAYGHRVTVGIDARDGYVATQGWTVTGRVLAEDFAVKLQACGLQDCIHTDIGKDGMLAGANVEASVRIAQASGMRVIVSGGVRDLDDVRRVASLETSGLMGLIAGKSLFAGTLDLKEALKVAADQGRG